MQTFAITVVGRDRPGIVADVTAALASLGANIEDSSMTLLRGSFAWMLVVAVSGSEETVGETLGELTSDALTIDVVALPHTRAVVAPPTHALTVYGGDRPGIVAAVASVIAAVGGNITDLSTRLAGALYVLAAEVFLPEGSEAEVRRGLATVADELGVDVSLHPIDVDEGF